MSNFTIKKMAKKNSELLELRKTRQKLADKKKIFAPLLTNFRIKKIEESANKSVENFSKENPKIGNSAGRFDSVPDIVQK